MSLVWCSVLTYDFSHDKACILLCHMCGCFSASYCIVTEAVILHEPTQLYSTRVILSPELEYAAVYNNPSPGVLS